jgi:predicted 3-demethylubiquinone-9 3-methyltransferase (glyoxalase superfamily)
MAKITPFLWFQDRLEEAVELYTSVFPNAKVTRMSRMGEGPSGPLMSAAFELEGQAFMAFNGRPPQHRFDESVSFFVRCETQAEVDRYWDRLTANGGEEQPCGWLKDPFGLSWQIVPATLERYLGDPDPAKVQRVVQAMLKMKRLDIAGLERAYAGK